MNITVPVVVPVGSTGNYLLALNQENQSQAYNHVLDAFASKNPDDASQQFSLVSPGTDEGTEKETQYSVVALPSDLFDRDRPIIFTAYTSAGEYIADLNITPSPWWPIASVASTTSFAFVEGPPNNDAFNGYLFLFKDVDGSTCLRSCTDYVGSSKTATINAALDFVLDTAVLVKLIPRLQGLSGITVDI